MSVHLLVLISCSGVEPPMLRLEGPAVVSVDRLGPVDGPRVVRGDGTTPDDLIWSLSRDGVARIEGGTVIAEGAGEVAVVAEWEGVQVEWTLRVELETLLAFESVPSTLTVGASTPLAVRATAGGSVVPPGPVTFASSNPAVLLVDDHGRATGVAPGVAYVTARAHGARAMAEVEVVP